VGGGKRGGYDGPVGTKKAENFKHKLKDFRRPKKANKGGGHDGGSARDLPLALLRYSLRQDRTTQKYQKWGGGRRERNKTTVLARSNRK